MGGIALLAGVTATFGANPIAAAPRPAVVAWPAPWTIDSAANPGGSSFQNQFDGVSCASQASCMAVGWYYNGEHTQTLAEYWNGSSWTPTTTLDVDNPLRDNELLAVSCPTASYCVAVGYRWTGSYSTSLIETWNGTSWQMATTADNGDTSSDTLNGVSCTSTTACVAVGEQGGDSFAQQWNGSSWSTPEQSEFAGFTPLAVSCATSSWCEAVGSATSGSNQVPESMTWSGGSDWVSTAGVDEGSSAYLRGVSCPAVGVCTAVGDAQETYKVTLIESLTDGAWALESSPNEGTGDNVLFAVRCQAAATCEAGGYYYDGAHNRTMVATQVEGPWALTLTPNVSTGSTEQDNIFYGFDCSSQTQCAGAGYYWNGTAVQTMLQHSFLAEGYWLASSDGSVASAGAAPSLVGATTAANPVVGIAATPDGNGYWTVTRNGSVYAEGDAQPLPGLPGLHVTVDDIVAIAPTTDGNGAWLIGADGGEFALGDAKFHGSLPGIGVHVSDIVGMVATPNGSGYLLVGADGGVFVFGGTFYGSLPGLHVAVNNIVGILPSPAGTGYDLVGSDGGVFAFGAGVHFFGSLPGIGVHVNNIVGLALTPDTQGYWLAGSDGGVFAFGDAKSLGHSAPALPVTAIAGR